MALPRRDMWAPTSALLHVAFTGLLTPSSPARTGLHRLRDVQTLLVWAGREQGTGHRVAGGDPTLVNHRLSWYLLLLSRKLLALFFSFTKSPKSHSAWWPPCSLWPETEPPQLLLLNTHAFVLAPTQKSTLLPSPSPPQDLPPPASTLSLTVLVLLFPFHLRGLNALWLN